VRSYGDAGRRGNEVGRTEGRGDVDVGIAVHERVAGAPYCGQTRAQMRRASARRGERRAAGARVRTEVVELGERVEEGLDRALAGFGV
jgi:hypothetical protein